MTGRPIAAEDYAGVLADMREHARHMRGVAERAAAAAEAYEIEHYADLYPGDFTDNGPGSPIEMTALPGWHVNAVARVMCDTAKREGRSVVAQFNGTPLTATPTTTPPEVLAEWDRHRTELMA